jgi:hypothetical protein
MGGLVSLTGINPQTGPPTLDAALRRPGVKSPQGGGKQLDKRSF